MTRVNKLASISMKPNNLSHYKILLMKQFQVENFLLALKQRKCLHLFTKRIIRQGTRKLIG